MDISPLAYVFSDVRPDRRGRKRSPAMGLLTLHRSIARDQKRSGYPGQQSSRANRYSVPPGRSMNVMLNEVKHLSAM